MRGSFTHRQTEDYLKNGIPAKLRDQLKVDERLLIATDGMTPEENTRHKLLYVGRRTIGRLGCAGCHDIPGFEDAKAIGTGLADWGRKEPSKLAFEQVVQYLAQENFVHGHGHIHNIEEALDPHHMDPDTGFFTEAVLHHEREGFIWQKLREPRSYDYRMTENKDYIERLRMPKFNLSDKQREAVITFVLGLVAEPPAAQYVYKADPRRQAVLDGERLITKFNCDGCHTFRMETWEFDYKPFDPKDDSSFQPPPKVVDYAFEKPHFTPKELADSKKVDNRGLGHATVTGMVNPELAEDDDGNPQYYFGLWRSLPINGQPWIVGGAEAPVLESRITNKIPPHGGNFARLLHPVALAMEQATNPNAKASDAWGWVPPPLVNEGIKVQTGWLHDFLLDPYQIRPAVVLRMPKFNMSSDEATQLANYFAAVDGAQYPYLVDHRTDSSYLARQDAEHPHRFEDALKIVTDNNYCVKCHKVGDFTPAGSAAALAPNLDRVYQRLRPDFLQKLDRQSKAAVAVHRHASQLPDRQAGRSEAVPGHQRGAGRSRGGSAVELADVHEGQAIDQAAGEAATPPTGRRPQRQESNQLQCTTGYGSQSYIALYCHPWRCPVAALGESRRCGSQRGQSGLRIPPATSDRRPMFPSARPRIRRAAHPNRQRAR